MKLPYFKLKQAFSEARDSFSYGSGVDKLTATAKLLGKSVANVGMVAIDLGSEVVKRTPELAGDYAKKNLEKNSHLMSEEQVVKAHELIEKGDESRKNRLENERNEEIKKREEEENR